MQNLTDDMLMLKVKSGDLDKLGLLYERHKKRLFGFFYNLGNNPSISEDLVQNVFVRMLKYKNSYSGKGSFGAWMFRMARNVNYDHHQKVARNSIAAGVSPEDIQVSEDRMTHKVDTEEHSFLLKKAMAQLGDEKRELLVLSKYRGLKFREIGETIGCSEGAAKVRVHRALNDLRKIFLQLETV